MTTESIVAILAAIGAGSLLPTLLKGMFGRSGERERALLQREKRATDWEEGLRDELRRDADKCMAANRELLARVDELHTTIEELREEIEGLKKELEVERNGRR